MRKKNSGVSVALSLSLSHRFFSQELLFQLTDSLDFIHSGVEAAVISCQEAVLKNLTFYNNSTGQAPSFITSDLCPSDCSGHGSCVQGTCHYNSGYVGDACVINSRKPPVLYNIVGYGLLIY